MYYCNGKKGICDTDLYNCGECEFYDNTGGYDTELGRELTPDIEYIFKTLDNSGPSSDDYYLTIRALKEEFGYEV